MTPVPSPNDVDVSRKRNLHREGPGYWILRRSVAPGLSADGQDPGGRPTRLDPHTYICVCPDRLLSWVSVPTMVPPGWVTARPALRVRVQTVRVQTVERRRHRPGLALAGPRGDTFTGWPLRGALPRAEKHPGK